MDIDEIQDAMTLAPFRPFRLMMADGDPVDVMGPEFIMRVKDRPTIYVSDPQTPHVHRIDVRHVTRLIVADDDEAVDFGTGMVGSNGTA